MSGRRRRRARSFRLKAAAIWKWSRSFESTGRRAAVQAALVIIETSGEWAQLFLPADDVVWPAYSSPVIGLVYF
jgi:hypothetical protein